MSPPSFILTYHSISDGPPPLCLSRARLEQDLDFLSRAGLAVASLQRLVGDLEADLPPPAGSVALTFDDAYRDFRESALPVLEERGLSATLFATSEPSSALVGGSLSLLAPEELGEIAARGVEVGAHSHRHADLTTLSDDELEADLESCAARLADFTGSAVEHFAYPFGRHDGRVRDAVSRHFRAACTTRLQLLGSGASLLEIPRIDAYYLGSPFLRRLLALDRARPYLWLRRWIRRLRGIP